ncbi:MAG: carboxypeptidase regulatory-like domain-containing protein [Acidobacteriota bacterium]|nr:carboxypeptidase regulatory-like domain-containing protein [Acidobacteriota bacterium]
MIRALWIALSAGTIAYGQISASLSGSVKDPTQAIISGAAVTARNVETGASLNVASDDSGRYELPALNPGTYEVRGSRTGFTDEVRTGIHLVVGQSAIIDLTLRVGQSNQAVTVNEDAPVVNATTTSIAGLVGQEQVRNLPLNGRSYDLLMVHLGNRHMTRALRVFKEFATQMIPTLFSELPS